VFKADPGVVPDDDVCEKAGIKVVKTSYQHNDLSDRGPDSVKTTIQGILDKFLEDDDNAPAPTGTAQPKAAEPGPVALSEPTRN
jgi:hypothetical protein